MGKISSQDIDYFRQAMKDEHVSPIRQHKTLLNSKIKKFLPASGAAASRLIDSQFSGSGFKNININLTDIIDIKVSSEEKLFFARTGLQHKLLYDLQGGKIFIECKLDLHGLTIDQARQSVSEFIQTALSQGNRCIQIIHGKGKSGSIPILKNYLNNWLPQISQVLAYSSAIPQHGGTGCLYVLLKKI